mgnify:CR=1 FL=1
MPNDTGKIAWGQIIIACLITAIFSFIVGIALYHYTSKSPDLVYEAFPPAEFTKQATQISIYNARVENAGSKEAEDIQIYFELPSSCNIQDIKVEPSLKSISYSMPQQTVPNAREIRFPILNQGESSTFSVLVDKGEAAQLKVEVRGKGVVGHIGRKEKSNLVSLIMSLSAGLATSVLLFSTALVLRRDSHEIKNEISELKVFYKKPR